VNILQNRINAVKHTKQNMYKIILSLRTTFTDKLLLWLSTFSRLLQQNAVQYFDLSS